MVVGEGGRKPSQQRWRWGPRTVPGGPSQAGRTQASQVLGCWQLTVGSEVGPEKEEVTFTLDCWGRGGRLERGPIVDRAAGGFEGGPSGPRTI